jgi:hypothetical protein
MKPITYKENISSKPVDCHATRAVLDVAETNAQHSTEVVAHLKQCPPCQRHDYELTNLRNLLANQPKVTVPDNFNLKLRQRIAASKQKEQPVFGGWRFIWQTAGAFTALVVIGLMVSVFQIQKPTHVSNIPSAHVAPPVAQPPAVSKHVEDQKGSRSDNEIASSDGLSERNKGRVSSEPKAKIFRDISAVRTNHSQPGMDAILVTLHDDSNRSRTMSVKQVIYGAQPIVNLGEIVDTDDLESSASSAESTIF